MNNRSLQAATSYDRVKAATLVNAPELAHLNLTNPTYVQSAHDSHEGGIHQLKMADLIKAIRIRRTDGQPANKISQDTITQFTFHFIRKRSYKNWEITHFSI